MKEKKNQKNFINSALKKISTSILTLRVPNNFIRNKTIYCSFMFSLVMSVSA